MRQSQQRARNGKFRQKADSVVGNHEEFTVTDVFPEVLLRLKGDGPGMRLWLWTSSLGERSFVANSAIHGLMKHVMY